MRYGSDRDASNRAPPSLFILRTVHVPIGVLIPLIAFAMYASYQVYLASNDIHRLPVCPRWPVASSSSTVPPSSVPQLPNNDSGSDHICDGYSALLAGIKPDIDEWRHHGGITHDIMQQILAIPTSWEGFHVHIRSGRIYVSNIKRGTESRVSASLMLTYLALHPIAHHIADTTFFVSTSDEGARSMPHLPIMSFNRPTKIRKAATATPTDGDDELIYGAPTSLLIPDFTWFAWPESLIGSYDDAMADITASAALHAWSTRTRRLFWRGAHSNARQPLQRVADEYPEITDMAYISWGGSRDGKRIMPTNYISLADQCKWQYLLHSEGLWGMYSSRFKYLMACGSVVFSTYPHTIMEEYWYHLLQPYVNYIPYTSYEKLGAEFHAALSSSSTDGHEAIGNAARQLTLLVDRRGAICYYQRLVLEYSAITMWLPSSPSLPLHSETIENAITSMLNAGLDSFMK